MSRYIDANVLKEAILKERDAIPLTTTERYSFGTEKPYRDGNSMRGGIRKALRCLEQTPTADVVEVRHGHWIEHIEKPSWLEDDVEVYYNCSVCGTSHWSIAPPFCPNCGAKMDGERSENGKS